MTERELAAIAFAPLSNVIFEAGVYGESTYGRCVFGAEPIRETFVLDESCLGTAVLGGSHTKSFLDQILAIIRDTRGRDRVVTAGRRRELRDAMNLEAHVRARRDIFVTEDRKHFIRHGRQENLQRLCGTLIMTVDEFIDHVTALPRDD